MTEHDFEHLLIHEKKAINVITELHQENLPLILWGAGDVASEVKTYLAKNEIFPVAIWVDEPEAKFFENLPIMTLEEIKTKYDKFNVILGHSHYNLGDLWLKKEPCICRMFYLVSVAYGQHDPIPYEFVKQNIHSYFTSFQMLEDDQSQKAMVAYLNSRMNNNIRYVQECIEYEQNYFQNDIFQIKQDEQYVDIGAFDGDTIKQFLEQNNRKYDSIYAFEPEEKNFRKLQEYVKMNHIKHISLYDIGTWKEKTTLNFRVNENEGSSISSKMEGVKISVDTLDHMLNGMPVSLIKINFYYGVLETLMGAREILKQQKPKLAIVVGFDAQALITIPQYLKNNFPEYKLFLRYNRCMPACLTLYAI